MSATDRLVAALQDAGLHRMAQRARDGEFSDFDTTLAFPKMRLAEELRAVARLRAWQPWTLALDLARRVELGEFDDGPREANEWLTSSGFDLRW